MIVVTLTSWLARIGNVKRVVESIMKNTVKPDRVYLNLSIEEFSGVPLPADLIHYFYSDERLIINWVDGPNTKPFKKVFPILRYIDDEDIIMTMDDDILLPEDFIETRLMDFNNYGGNTPITPVLQSCWIGGNVMGSTAVMKKKMLYGWDRYVNETVVHTYNDDRTYLYLMYLNGYTTKPVTRYTERALKRMTYNDTHSMRLNGMYEMGKSYDGIVEPVVKSLTGTTIEKAFGFFRKEKTPEPMEGKHDVVIPWCHSGVASKMMECGDRLELEYVVASMYKFCSSWLGRIFIVGSEPPESIRDGVVWIPCDDPYTHAKDANIIHKILYAIENVPDLSEDFVKASDDQVVTCDTSFGDLTPRIVRMYSEWTEQKWTANRRIDRWHDNLWLTLHLFDLKKAYFAEPHIWCPYNKHKFVEMCEKYNWRKSRACIDNTLYYNFIDYPPVPQFDHLHLSKGNTKEILRTLMIEDIPRHLSWTDNAFTEKKFRDILENIIFEK